MAIGETEAARPPFVFWTCLWAGGLAVILVATAYDIINPDLGVPLGRDFSNLYVAGTLALQGQAYLAFDPDTFRLAIKDIVGTLTQQVYSYPPHALFVAVPFALFPYEWSLTVWSLFTLAFFYWAARPYVGFAPILAVLTPAAALNIWCGQHGLLLGALWLVYFRLLGERPVSAGLVAAAMTFKPHLGLLIGLTSLTNWRTVLTAIGGTAALVLASAWAFEWSGWYGFISENVGTHVGFLTQQSDDFYFRLMPSAYAAYGRNNIAAALQLLVALAALAMVVRYRRIDPFVLATATFLIVPYAFTYDMPVACLGFAIVLWREWATLRSWERAALAIAFLTPAIALAIEHWGAMAAAPALLAALYVQTKPGEMVAGTI